MVTDVQDIIKRHQAQIITSLKDHDIRLDLSVLKCLKMLNFCLTRKSLEKVRQYILSTVIALKKKLMIVRFRASSRSNDVIAFIIFIIPIMEYMKK